MPNNFRNTRRARARLAPAYRGCAGCLCGLLIGLAHAQSVGEAPPASAAEARIVLPDIASPRRYDIEIRPDASHLTFRGSVRVRIDVKRPTSTITLNAADLTIDRAAFDEQPAAPKIRQDAERQQLTLIAGALIQPGEHTLSIDYHGRIYQQPAGLFALDYETPKGKRRALYTQFEATDARRFVPCWDEPGSKAVFVLSAVVPSGLMAVSNMPIASTQPLSGELQRVNFAPSPRMSSYLLFFALGDFERAHRGLGKVDLGVIVKRGDSAKAAFALETAAQILPYYNDYFGARYPLAKLDLIAAPVGRSFGAMENWGAILFSEPLLLLDPNLSTESDRQHVYGAIAHEMAHQWFGNLVTMAWWDDLWLNEGFATWMSYKVTDRFHPEWKVWIQSEPELRSAMNQDAGEGTHPIVTPIRDPEQASAAFDELTYVKAAAVIRMIEAYVGEEAFRDGVRAYMARYSHANTVSDDLWRELESASSVPVQGIAGDFTLLPGVPLIDVKEADGLVTLSLDRFGIEQASRVAQSWRVPVVVATAGGEARRAIVTAQQPATMPAADSLLVNAGQTGYFVSRYSPVLFRRLLDRFGELSAEDQLGLLGDTSALGNAGYLPMAWFLELVRALPSDADPTVWAAVCGELIAVGRHYDEGAQAGAFRSWVRTELAPVFARVGWDPRPGESDNLTTLRGTLLDTLAEADDESVIGEARKRFQQLAGDPGALQGETRSAVLKIVALHADPAAWEALHALARDSRSTLEQEPLYRVLGRTRDPALAQRALELSVSGEPPRTTAAEILQAVAQRHAAPAFEFAAAHWNQVSQLLSPFFAGRFATEVAAGSDDLRTVAGLSEFCDRTRSACIPGEVRKAIASIRYLASIKQQRLSEIDRWLANSGYAVTDRWLLGGAGGWDYLTFDGPRHRLFVTRSDRIEIVDAKSGRISGTIPNTAGAHGVAIAEDLKLGFTSNGRSDSMTVFDLDSLGTLGTVAVPGDNPDAIVYEPKTRRVFTFNGRSRDATVFDANSLTVLGSLAMPDKPEFAVADGEGRVYVNIESAPGQLLLIDARRLAILETWTLTGCDRPTGLAIDRTRHRLFSTCSNGVLVITDGQSGAQLARVAIGSAPDAAAFDDASGTVFSSNGEGNLTVVREVSSGVYAAFDPVPTQRGARTMAMDPDSHRIFLVSSEFTTPPGTADNPNPRPQPVAETATILVLQRQLVN
jgi:aminopeptidase N/DNA-binding beta-propeller fold protein YncE